MGPPRRLADGNEPERAALAQLARAPASQPVVRLTTPGNVLSWLPITDPAASADNAAMLSYWGITRGPKLYYCQAAPAWSK